MARSGRPRPELPPPLTVSKVALALAVLAWTAFLTWRFAAAAYVTGLDHSLIGAGRITPELAVVLLGAAAAVIPGLLALMVGRVVVFRVLTALLFPAGLAAGLVLALTSGTAAAVATLAFLLLWSLLVGEGLLATLSADGGFLATAARLPLAVGLGLAALSFAVLGLGLAHLVGDVSLAVVLLAGLILAGLALRRRLPWPLVLRLPAAGHSPWAFFEHAALAAIIVACVTSFGASLAPQTAFDALHYHLAIPRFILAEGRFVERPDIVQSYFPLGLEMTYVPATSLGGEAAADLVHWAFMPLTAVLLWSAGDRLFGRPAGSMAAAVYALMPLVVVEAPTASSDLAMTFYIAAGAIVLADLSARPDPRLAALAGALFGLSLTFKIVSGLYVIAAGLTFVGVILWWGRRREALFHATLFAAGGLATGAPWLILRWIQTGNPVFPLFNNVFRSGMWPPVNERFDLFLYGIGHGLRQFARVWWEASIYPWKFGQGTPPWLFGVPLAAALAVLVAWPLLRRERGPLTWTAVAFLGFAAWFYWSQYHRYGLPAVTLLALPAGAAIGAAFERVWGRFASAPAVVLLAVWFGAGMTTAFGIPATEPYPTGVVLGREGREHYRERFIPDYLPLAFVDQQTRGTADRAVIYGYPYNYFVINRVYDSILPPELSPFRRIAASGLVDRQLARELLAQDFRWLIVDYRTPPEADPSVDWLTSGILTAQFLAEHTEMVYERYDVRVYKIVADEDLGR